MQARLDEYFQDTTDINALSNEFQGASNDNEIETLASRHTPQNLARLGNLEYIIFDDGDKIEFDIESCYVAADRRRNIYLVGLGVVFDAEHRPDKIDGLSCLGKVYEIQYRTAKQHIGDGETISFYHNFGEVDGVLPSLYVDDEGFPLLIGGNYGIKSEGIIN